MVEALKYVMYSNTPLHIKALWAVNVDSTETLLVPKRSVINVGLWTLFSSSEFTSSIFPS